MHLRLGNLTVAQFAERVHAEIQPDELAWLEERRTNDANFTDPTKFHIFDSPRVMVVIGAECYDETLSTWQLINARRLFNPEVPFYPASKHAEVVGETDAEH